MDFLADKFLFSGEIVYLPLWGRGTVPTVDEVVFALLQFKILFVLL